MIQPRSLGTRLTLTLAIALILASLLGCIGSQVSEKDVENTAYARLTGTAQTEKDAESTVYARLTSTAESWTPTPSLTPTSTPTPTPTNTPTPRPTATPTITPSPTRRPPTATSIPPDQQVMRFLNDTQPYRATEEAARETLIKTWNNARWLHEQVNAVDAYVKTVEPILPKLEAVKVPAEAKAYRDHYVNTLHALFEAIKAINWGIVQNNDNIVISAIRDTNKNLWELEDKVDPELNALADKYGLYFNGSTGKWEKKP